MRTFDIEGTIVECEQLETTRVWRCTCDYYKQRRTRAAAQGGDAYCPHIAVAVMQCIRDGSVDPNDEAAGEFEAFIKIADRIP